MIGLVLVSHSSALADGLADLVRQMASDVRIVPAGGDDDGGLGTSFDRISAAIQEADDGDGVVMLYDLGSAQLTSEMALEMLDDDQASRVRLVDAPLVEGALAAATRVDERASLDDVVTAAREAGAGFAPDDAARTDVGEAEADEGAGDTEGDDGAVVRVVSLTNEAGLHARPAARFTKAVGGYDAEVRVAVGDQPAPDDFVNGRSTLSVVSLGGRRGDTLTIRATGAQAQEAADGLAGLVEGGLGEG